MLRSHFTVCLHRINILCIFCGLCIHIRRLGSSSDHSQLRPRRPCGLSVDDVACGTRRRPPGDGQSLRRGRDLPQLRSCQRRFSGYPSATVTSPVSLSTDLPVSANRISIGSPCCQPGVHIIVGLSQLLQQFPAIAALSVYPVSGSSGQRSQVIFTLL